MGKVLGSQGQKEKKKRQRWHSFSTMSSVCVSGLAGDSVEYHNPSKAPVVEFKNEAMQVTDLKRVLEQLGGHEHVPASVRHRVEDVFSSPGILVRYSVD